MNEAINVSVQVTYYENNDLHFSRPVYPGFRCSVWLDNSDFTAVEWNSIDKGIMFPGETCIVSMNLLPTALLQKLEIGTDLYWGVPYNSVGSCKIIDM